MALGNSRGASFPILVPGTGCLPNRVAETLWCPFRTGLEPCEALVWLESPRPAIKLPSRPGLLLGNPTFPGRVPTPLQDRQPLGYEIQRTLRRRALTAQFPLKGAGLETLGLTLQP